MLKNKRILFIAPSFFGYEQDIIDELTALGAEVDYFDERPFTSSIAKISNRINFKFFIKNEIFKYFNNIINESLKNKYDYLFVIAPETMDQEFVNKIIAANKNMVSILYMWDSFRNKSNARRVVHCFDKVFSFDPTDRDIVDNVRFLPLFYNNDFRHEIRHQELDVQYATSFIGTVHSDRVKLAKNILKLYKAKGLNTYSFFYCPSKLLFILKKLFTSEFDFISYSDVSFRPMSKVQIKNILLQSSSVIDIHHPNQTGLTMRTIEMLGLNKKLITTNSDVKSYDFFNSNNIFVINRENVIISDEFFTSSYIETVPRSDNKYSIRNWIRHLFNDNL